MNVFNDRTSRLNVLIIISTYGTIDHILMPRWWISWALTWSEFNSDLYHYMIYTYMYTLRTILTTNIVCICWLNKYIFADIPILPPFSLLLSLGLWLRWYLWCFSVWTVRKCVINFTRKRPTIQVGIFLFYFSKLWLYCCFVLFRFFCFAFCLFSFFFGGG